MYPQQQGFGGYPQYPSSGQYVGAPPPSAGFSVGGGYPGGGYPTGEYPPPAGGGGYAGGVESGGDSYGDNMGAFSSKEVRMGFIRKVYSILSVQLLVTVAFICFFTYHKDTNAWAKKGGVVLMFAALGASIVSLCTLACCGGVRRKFPANFICLAIFTLAQSVVLGFASAFSKSDAVAMAIGITAIVVISLTIFAMQTKIDFTACTGIAFVALIVFMVAGIVLIFVRIPIVHMIYACIGALLFSFYLIIDTQMIVGGNHKSQISPEEYIFGVITLYTDIINIFLYILQILNYANSD